MQGHASVRDVYTNNDFIFNVQVDNCFLVPQMIFSSPWNQAGPTLISINISLSAASSLSQVFVRPCSHLAFTCSIWWCHHNWSTLSTGLTTPKMHCIALSKARLIITTFKVVLFTLQNFLSNNRQAYSCCSHTRRLIADKGSNISSSLTRRNVQWVLISKVKMFYKNTREKLRYTYHACIMLLDVVVGMNWRIGSFHVWSDHLMRMWMPGVNMASDVYR